MKKIIRNVINGGKFPIKEYGITPDNIRQLWTILDEKKLFTQYDCMTGISKTVDLQDVNPVHFFNAFLEDRIHDWFIRGDELHYQPHSSKKGQLCNLLIITN